MKTTYTTHGTCARFIDIEIDDDVILGVNFIGGCRGNTQGLSALLKEMPVEEAISRLKGIVCRGMTSCPDQLATALQELRLDKAS